MNPLLLPPHARGEVLKEIKKRNGKMEKSEVLDLLKQVTGSEKVRYDDGQNELHFFDDVTSSWLYFGDWNEKTERELKFLAEEMIDSFDSEIDF